MMNSDQSAIHKLKLNEREGLEALYKKYKDKLYFFCFKYVKSSDEAKDILQETFIKVWNYREKIDESQNFEAFLFKLIKNRLLNALNAESIRKRHEESSSFIVPQDTNETEDEVIYNDYAAIVNEAIEALPVKRKRVFTLSRNEGFTYAEIAKTLGISVNTVEIHMTNALRDIKHFMHQRTEEEFSF
jgi:RNA polymerase sigma-70 factor, ECF subfamily